MTEAMIQVHGVVKQFEHGRIRALDGMNLDVARGEFVAITGRSGSGKSTLLHLLAALDRPTFGSIVVDGHELTARNLRRGRRLDRFRREHVGLVFQLHNLLPQLTALENVEVAMMGTRRTRRMQREAAARLLSEVGLADRAHGRPAELSGGERQRVAIARALANDPPLILADEPTGNLDTESVDDVLRLLRTVRATHASTLVMVTHDPLVAAAADRRIRVIDGRIAEPPSEASTDAPSATKSGALAEPAKLPGRAG